MIYLLVLKTNNDFIKFHSSCITFLIVPCWIFLAASLLLTTELVTALQIPINKSLLVLRVGDIEGVGVGGEDGDGGEVY